MKKLIKTYRNGSGRKISDTYRNYNIGRQIDDKTLEFEQKLFELLAEYESYLELVSLDSITNEKANSLDRIVPEEDD